MPGSAACRLGRPSNDAGQPRGHQERRQPGAAQRAGIVVELLQDVTQSQRCCHLSALFALPHTDIVDRFGQ